MEGFGIFTLFVVLFFGLMPFIALMCIWANTGATADYMKKMWLHQCEEDGLDPKTGKRLVAGPLNG